MQKIICIYPCRSVLGNSFDILVGEIYHIGDHDIFDNDTVRLNSKSNNRLGLFLMSNFITLDEWREKQIEKIVNNV
jgi:hypothetical protein